MKWMREVVVDVLRAPSQVRIGQTEIQPGDPAIAAVVMIAWDPVMALPKRRRSGGAPPARATDAGGARPPCSRKDMERTS